MTDIPLDALLTLGEKDGSDESVLTGRQRLMLAIVRRCEGMIEMSNLCDLLDDLAIAYDTPEEALAAIEAGHIKFGKDN